MYELDPSDSYTSLHGVLGESLGIGPSFGRHLSMIAGIQGNLPILTFLKSQAHCNSDADS
jgi:hypothetical protein